MRATVATGVAAAVLLSGDGCSKEEAGCATTPHGVYAFYTEGGDGKLGQPEQLGDAEVAIREGALVLRTIVQAKDPNVRLSAKATAPSSEGMALTAIKEAANDARTGILEDLKLLREPVVTDEQLHLAESRLVADSSVATTTGLTGEVGKKANEYLAQGLGALTVIKVAC